MSDFDNVDWLETSGEPTKDVAPPGEYEAKIISCEKYQSKSSDNWSVRVIFDLQNGAFKEHTEYFSLWSANADAKRISNEMFTQLCKATGFKSFPDDVHSLVNKTLDLGLYHKEETWTNNEGEEVNSKKTKIGEYLSSVSPTAPSGGKPKSPPIL